MELRDKNTGEICKILIVNEHGITIRNPDGSTKFYKTIAELMEEKEEFDKTNRSHVLGISTNNETVSIRYDSCDNAENAAIKLDALYRLMDNGFEFDGFMEDYTRIGRSDVFRVGRRYIHFNKSEAEDWLRENWDDLVMVFGDAETNFVTESNDEEIDL